MSHSVTNEEYDKIFKDALQECRLLIVQCRSDFILNNSTPLPGILDSKELKIYVSGGIETLDRLDKALEYACKITRELTEELTGAGN